MSITSTIYDDRYHRRFSISSAGEITDPAPRNKGKGAVLTAESHIRIITEGLGAANTIDVKVRLNDSPTFTTLYTLTGNENKVLDVTAWDVVHYDVTNYDGSEGTLTVSGFIKNPPPGLAADSVKLTDNDGDIADVVSTGGGEFGLVVVPEIETTTPKITNFNIAAIATEYSVTITTGAKKILIQHRDGGTVEFSFTAGLASYITLFKGTTYTEENLNLQGITLYFRSNKTGTLEILEWF